MQESLFTVGEQVWIIVDRLPLSVVDGTFMGMYAFVSEDHYFVQVKNQIVAVRGNLIFLKEEDAWKGLLKELNTRLGVAEEVKSSLRRDVNILSERVASLEIKLNSLIVWAEGRLIKPFKVNFVEDISGFRELKFQEKKA